MRPPGPFLRWAGGKRRLLPVLRAALPATFAHYYEPFLGGGALFFDLPPMGDAAHLNDATDDLIHAYTVLRDTPSELITTLGTLGEVTTKSAYLAVRASEPAMPLGRAARFIYLNRTGFNGLYRVNRSGKFNVPFGQLANPTVCNEDLLASDTAHLRGVHLRAGGYADALSGAGPGDFVYLDPPYIPLSPTAAFAAYTPGGFTEPDQRALADEVDRLTALGALVMLSNSDTPLTRDIFARMNLHTVSVHRSISATLSGRGTVTEVVGVNYDPAAMADPAAFAALTL